MQNSVDRETTTAKREVLVTLKGKTGPGQVREVEAVWSTLAGWRPKMAMKVTEITMALAQEISTGQVTPPDKAEEMKVKIELLEGQEPTAQQLARSWLREFGV